MDEEYVKKLEEENVLVSEIICKQTKLVNRLQRILRLSLICHRHAISKNTLAYTTFIRDDKITSEVVAEKNLMLKNHLKDLTGLSIDGLDFETTTALEYSDKIINSIFEDCNHE